jgi:hypothetical protein
LLERSRPLAGLITVAAAGLLLTAPATVGAQAQTEGRAQSLVALEKELAALRAQITDVPVLADTVEQLGARVAALAERVEALSKTGGRGAPELATALDELRSGLAAARRDLDVVRAQLHEVEQASLGAGLGGLGEGDGFRWSSTDGRFALRLYGYGQVRHAVTVAGSEVTETGFRLRRGRLGVSGLAGSDRLRFDVLAELAEAPALRNYQAEYALRPWALIRAGQGKVPFTRSFMTGDDEIDFTDRSSVLEAFRHDRDIGLSLLGALRQGRLWYQLGVFNGAGQNTGNDNRDLLAVVRVEAAVLGSRLGGYGDLERSATPSLTVGAGATHDLVRLPAAVAGTDTGNLDVDGDGEVDNVRVVSASADVLLRWRGWELAAEGLLRAEEWGAILADPANQELASAVGAPDGDAVRLGMVAQVSYALLPRLLLVAARGSYGRVPVLLLGGRSRSAPPPGDRLLELDLLVQLYRLGARCLGLQYTLADPSRNGGEPAGPVQHRLVLEGQLRF